MPLSDAERQIVDRFVDAWQHRDIPKPAARLSQDAVLRMPPELAVFTGREQIVQFFTTVPANGRLDLIELAVVRANGQPALAAYLPDDDRGACRGYGTMVRDVTDNQISSIVGFEVPGGQCKARSMVTRT